MAIEIPIQVARGARSVNGGAEPKLKPGEIAHYTCCDRLAVGTERGENVMQARYNDITELETAAKANYVPLTRTINGKPMTSNITLTASDVGAASLAQLVPVLFTIPTYNWVVNSVYFDYGYRASLTIAGVTINDRVDIAFDPSVINYVLDAEVMPANASFSGGVYLYAKNKPEATLTGNYIVRKAL